MFGRILSGPNNTLAVRCRDESATMVCMSDTPREIVWTYDGGAVSSPPCRNFTDVFRAQDDLITSSCAISSIIDEARRDQNIRTISGPYGCTDATSRGITATSVVVVLGVY